MDARRIPKGNYLLVFPLRMDGDCTNGGVTSPARGHKAFYLVEEGDERAVNDVKALQANALVERDPPPILVVKRRHFAWGPSIIAVPYEGKDEGKAGWMAGGNYVHTSDSRFREWVWDGPIAVHDRQETWEQYEALSR
jgi:hypothetical protein